jgi:hypothetical protein
MTGCLMSMNLMLDFSERYLLIRILRDKRWRFL